MKCDKDGKTGINKNDMSNECFRMFRFSFIDNFSDCCKLGIMNERRKINSSMIVVKYK